MNKLTRYFVNQYREDSEWKQRIKKKYIQLENYFKYSGKIEEDATCELGEDINRKHFFAKKKKIKDAEITTVLNQRDSLIIDYFYRNSNQTIEKMAEDLGVCKEIISRTITKHLKIQK